MALTWPTLDLYISFDNTLWYDDGVCTWVDMTARIKRVSFNRGRQRQLNSPQAGQMTVVLDNADGVLDPDNSGSTYYGTMQAGRLLRLRATYSAVLYPLFIGQAEDWGTTELGPSGEPEITIQVTDYMGRFAYGRTLNGRNIGGDYVGPMIEYWFGRWSTVIPTVIDRGTILVFDLDTIPGNGALNGSVDFDARTIFDLLRQCETESTYFFDGSGTFCYHDHNRRHGVQPVIQATFDNDTTQQAAGALPFEDATYTNDRTDVYNRASLTPYGGSTSFPDPTLATDATSIALHGYRTLTRTVPVSGATQATDLANQLVQYYREAVPRLTNITVNGLAQVAALWLAILNLEISDPIRIRRRPYPVASVSPLRDYFIEGYSVEIVVDGEPSWQVRYDVSPAIDGYHGPFIGGTGVAFPTSPANDDLFYRTDLNLLCLYDGSRWVTVQEYPVTISGETAIPLTTSGAVLGRAALRRDYTLYLTSVAIAYNVLTTNNGSNYWTIAIKNDAGSSLGSVSTAAATAGTFTAAALTINATTTSLFLYADATKTAGAPGNIYLYVTANYRLVVT